MCEEHSQFAFRQGGKLVRGVDRGAHDSAKPASLEFAWLKQSDPRRAAVYHCAEHKHAVRNVLAYIKIGAVLAVVGVIFLFLVLPLGLVLLLAGAGLGAAGFILRQRELSDPASRPPLPLFPHVNSVDVVERLNGEVYLGEDSYKSMAEDSVTGQIVIDMSANDGQEWLGQYRKRYGLQEGEPVKFAAGFALLEGEAGLHFTNGRDVVRPDGTGFSFSGDSAARHPLFEAVPGRPPGEWKLSASYRVQPERVPKDIPLWIVPSVVPSSDRRTLEIDLHWNHLGVEGAELELTRFELIELKVPTSWGAVQGFDPDGPTIESGNKGKRVIRWEQIPPSDSLTDQRRLAVPWGSKSRPLILRFEKPVLPDRSAHDAKEYEPAGNGSQRSSETEDPRFSGTLKATFGRTLSGVRGIEIYLPGGGLVQADGRAGRPSVRARTEVTVAFSISLGAIHYQDDWAAPDDSNARKQKDDAERDQYAPAHGWSGGEERESRFRNKTDEFSGVIPDYRAVIDLTNLISDQGYYVKSVVEHPPYRDDGHANVVKRVWDIAGRWYDGVFPVDFDINLRGEEGGEDFRAVAGRTVAQVTVKGTYINDARHEQLKKIEERWDNLHGHVTGLLGRLAAGADGAKAIASAGMPSEWDDAFLHEAGGENRGAGADYFKPDTVFMEAEVVETPPADNWSDDYDRAQFLAELRKQQQSADDAVLAGRISEDTHRGIIARIDTELRKLGERA